MGLELAFGHLGVMTAQASYLVQMGRGVLIGQRACWLVTSAEESIDSTRAGATDCLHSAATFSHLECPQNLVAIQGLVFSLLKMAASDG